MHRLLFILLGLGLQTIQGHILLVDYSSFHSKGDPCTLQIGRSKYRETTSQSCQGYGVLDLGTYKPSQVLLRKLDSSSPAPISNFDLIDGFFWPFYPDVLLQFNPRVPFTSSSKTLSAWQSSHGNLTSPSKMSIMIRTPSHTNVKVVVWCTGNHQTFDFDGLYTFECQTGFFTADVFLSRAIDFTKGDGYRGFYQVALWSQPFDSNSKTLAFLRSSEEIQEYVLDSPHLHIISQDANRMVDFSQKEIVWV